MRVLLQPEPLALINAGFTTTARLGAAVGRGLFLFFSLRVGGRNHGSSGLRLSFNEEAAFIPPPWRLAALAKFTVAFKDAKYRLINAGLIW